MVTWTAETVNQSDKSYLASWTPGEWKAISVVIDIPVVDLTKINTTAKQKAILQSIADEFSLGTIPNVTWVDYTSGKMAVLTIGANTVTIRVDTTTKRGYVETFITAAYPPEHIARMITTLLGGTEFTSHIITRGAPGTIPQKV